MNPDKASYTRSLGTQGCLGGHFTVYKDHVEGDSKISSWKTNRGKNN
jgi:hypothetical protein